MSMRFFFSFSLILRVTNCTNKLLLFFLYLVPIKLTSKGNFATEEKHTVQYVFPLWQSFPGKSKWRPILAVPCLVGLVGNEWRSPGKSNSQREQVVNLAIISFSEVNIVGRKLDQLSEMKGQFEGTSSNFKLKTVLNFI